MGFTATVTASHIVADGDPHMFPGFSQISDTTFFTKPLTTFLTCFNRGERRKYAGKKVRLNRISNSQPPGHEYDALTTKPPGSGFIQEQTAQSVQPDRGTTLFPKACKVAIGNLRISKLITSTPGRERDSSI